MKAHIRAWGNSLAVRIPKLAADQLQLAPDSEVRLTVIDGTLVIEPHAQASLDDLLAKVEPHHQRPEMWS